MKKIDQTLKDENKIKVGIICEGSPDSDVLVFEYLIKKINPNIDVVRNPLGTKEDIFKDCGKTSKNLFSIDKCEKVFILWDLEPNWKRKIKPCRKEDREKILKALENEKVDKNKIFLICIKTMLEAWLLADESALRNYLLARENIDQIKKPENEKDPKAKLINIFTRYKGKDYQEIKDPKEIIKLVDIKKISRKCSTFKRFEDKIKLV